MPEHFFKTVYFPREKCAAGRSARVTLSFPSELAGAESSVQFRTFVTRMTSREFRIALGDPILEEAEETAEKQRRSFSNHCLTILLERFSSLFPSGESAPVFQSQMLFPFASAVKRPSDSKERGVTFQENQNRSVHSWYPYVEGFSAGYVRDTLLRNSPTPRTVYDPFGGSGTTQLSASLLGIRSFYSEVNPFMVFVADTKINCSAWARRNLSAATKAVQEFTKKLNDRNLDSVGSGLNAEIGAFERSFPERDFFEEIHLRHLFAAKSIANEIAGECEPIRNLLLLACASNVVHSSNMTRRADLRRRRADEYKTRVVNVSKYVSTSIAKMLRDIENLPSEMAPAVLVSNDCRFQDTQYQNSFDIALTSPPYLNGTNYFRNTKLELRFLDMISNETELASLHKRAVVAGINSVSKAHPLAHRYESVEVVASNLDSCAADRRIPLLVRQYFSDMHDVLASVFGVLSPGGSLFLDIGDSKFYGIHVPTDVLLQEVGMSVGFEVAHRHVLAKRYSRDKSDLVQVEIVFRKPACAQHRTFHSSSTGLEQKIAEFQSRLPYKSPPYTNRNWGHSLHSLCSYQGKLKPAVAHWAISHFVSSKGRVLDPLGGVGTVGFEAALSGRYAVSNDKSPFASTIAAAKLNPPTRREAEEAVDHFASALATIDVREQDYKSADFGLNGTVKDYYHPDTLNEILKARQLFRRFLNRKTKTSAEYFLWASLLHVLHGNRPYALSRTSHPIVPLHPKGKSIYKPIVAHIARRIALALKEALPQSFVPGLGVYGDFRELTPEMIGRFECILTSPPFMGMRFDRPNWLRMWFCGWEETDFHTKSLKFLEREQSKSTLVYRSFFSTCQRLIEPNGLIILHVGDDRRGGLVQSLIELGNDVFKLIGNIIEDVQAIEQHGLSDKGNRTLTHHLLVFQNR